MVSGPERYRCPPRRRNLAVAKYWPAAAGPAASSWCARIHASDSEHPSLRRWHHRRGTCLAPRVRQRQAATPSTLASPIRSPCSRRVAGNTSFRTHSVGTWQLVGPVNHFLRGVALQIEVDKQDFLSGGGSRINASGFTSPRARRTFISCTIPRYRRSSAVGLQTPPPRTFDPAL
jgi:hypothetical protein